MQGLLTLKEPGNVQVCIVDTLTRPTSAISHIIRHRRLSSEADQHKGGQADPLRFYVALTRARKSTWAWMEKELFGTPVLRAAKQHRAVHAGDAYAQVFIHKIFDAILEMTIPFVAH